VPEQPSSLGLAAAPGPTLSLSAFKTWFWRPPRPHGEAIAHRRVSPLELLHDLVYAAVIAQAGLRLAGQVSVRGLVDFALVFSLTYIAWTQGSTYLELHGRNNGRTRAFVFVQIGILAILAVYAAESSAVGGSDFAIAYASFLLVMTYLWYDVRRQDIALGHREFVAEAGLYVVAMGISAVAILVSALLPPQLRLTAWAVYTVAWTLLLLISGRAGVGISRALTPTDSLVDRFGTFTMIVLGEVVFGVVDGLSRSPLDFMTISTGMIALVVGFGFWWIYFDVVGGRFPNRDGRALAHWMLSHGPITLSIAAAGVGMVSLIEHAHDPSASAPTSWLLSGAVAIGLVFLIFASRALAGARTLETAFRPLWFGMAAGAVLSLFVGWVRPAPWLLAVVLVVVLGLIWAIAVRGFVLAGAWAAEEAPG